MGLTEYVTPTDTFWCDVCMRKQAMGTKMFSCRWCDYDKCIVCYDRGDERRPELAPELTRISWLYRKQPTQTLTSKVPTLIEKGKPTRPKIEFSPEDALPTDPVWRQLGLRKGRGSIPYFASGYSGGFTGKD